VIFLLGSSTFCPALAAHPSNPFFRHLEVDLTDPLYTESGSLGPVSPISILLIEIQA